MSMQRIGYGYLALLLLGACQSGHGENAAKHAQESARALHPDYKKPEGYKTECFGRSVFDVPGEVEWAMVDPEVRNKGIQFTDNIGTMGERLDYGPYTDIRVTYAATRKDWDWLKELEGREHESYAVPYPDSMGWRAGNSLYVYLWRNDRIYRFLFSSSDDSFEKSKQALLDVLSRFRPRATHEIPADPGVCFTHGFIADDGTVGFRMQNTLRLKSTPNVTYTINTGKNGDDTEPVRLDVMASTLPVLNGLEGMIVGQQVQKRIGPERVKIGPYHGMAGGFTINPDPNGPKEQEVAYHMEAGQGGVANSDIFPFIHVQMDGYPKAADRTLMQSAPPFDSSYARWKDLLSSIRLKTLPRPLTSEEEKKIADSVVNPPKDTIDPAEIAFRQRLADLKKQDKKAEQAERDARAVAEAIRREIPARVDCSTGKLIQLNGKAPLRVEMRSLTDLLGMRPVPTILSYGPLPRAGMAEYMGAPEQVLLRQPLDKNGYLTIPQNLEDRIAKHLCEGYRLWVNFPGNSLQVIVQDSPANGGKAKTEAH